MSRILRIATCLLAVFALKAADNQLTAQEKTAGWRLLFDGRTFANWEDPGAKSPPGDSFTIADGCLKAVAHPKIQEDLVSLARFGDFELEWDWKISPRGNSGLKYKIQDRVPVPNTGRKFEDEVNAALKNRAAGRFPGGQLYTVAFEYQLVDNAGPDPTRNGPTHGAAALYDILAPTKDATRPVGEFNHSRLVVRGKHIEHWLNGEKVVEGDLDGPEASAHLARRWGAGSPMYELLTKQPRERCPIALQNHDDDAWFKNIKIRELQ
jgi:hypothetical protein